MERVWCLPFLRGDCLGDQSTSHRGHRLRRMWLLDEYSFSRIDYDEPKYSFHDHSTRHLQARSKDTEPSIEEHGSVRTANATNVYARAPKRSLVKPASRTDDLQSSTFTTDYEPRPLTKLDLIASRRAWKIVGRSDFALSIREQHLQTTRVEVDRLRQLLRPE
jgi:hypothetical protein